MKKKISNLISQKLSDILSIGYADVNESPVLYEFSLTQFYLKTVEGFIKLEQYDGSNGIYVGISIVDEIDRSINIDEDDVFCFSSIYSLIMGVYTYDYSIEKIIMYGENYIENNTCYSEGIEIVLLNTQGDKKVIYIDPYDLDGLVIGRKNYNEVWEGNKKISLSKCIGS